MKPLTRYSNGNVLVSIYSDGTKTREWFNDLKTDRVEMIDINTSTYCDNDCSYCYLGANEKGSNGDPEDPILKTIPPHTEVALNWCDKELLDRFIDVLVDRECIVNVTVNIKSIIKDESIIDYLKEAQAAGRIYGFGLSVDRFDYRQYNLYFKINKLNNLVVHVINGVVSVHTIINLTSAFSKFLILGGKPLPKNSAYKYTFLTEDEMKLLMKMIACISFDNLALKQLNIKELYDDIYDDYFMGEDGQFSFYIDLVSNTYSISSTHEPYGNYVGLSVDRMFKNIQQVLSD